MNRHIDDGDDDPRVLEAAREYLAELEAGRVPNRAVYFARHPELAATLSDCFDSIEFAHCGARALRPPSPSPVAEYPADPLGDFQILRELGRGGMGVVYEAVQLSLGRRVALKVLPFAASLDAKQLQRFKTEAHAAAQLHHTNIVPVHAVGCERGVHFYAMQLIEGRSLDRVIHELRGDDAGPRSGGTTLDFHDGRTATASVATRTSSRSLRNRETFRTTARIAAQVADALEFAHEAGVVHRDIKPANLMLDAKGAVWVTDFGLAHVAADVGLTQTGSLIGTLRYMSPEQASGRRVLIDHRTDIYSLGATLYEMLTLEPIFAGQDRQTLLNQILNDEPRPLRQIARSIPVELETIVLKAVAKIPAERYATAGEMAADLRRFLDERPILARPPTLVDRTRKWMRRHPSFVGAAVLLLVTGLLCLATTTALTQKAYRLERKRAQEAEERFALARQAADDIIQIADEEIADKPFMEGTYKRMLEAALGHYQKFIDQRRNDPDAQAELEVTRKRVQAIVDDLAVLQGDRQVPLLRNPAVQDDLKVSPEQRDRIADLTRRQDERRDDFRGYHRLTADQRRKLFVERARVNETEVAAILSAEQIRRLRQIALQWQGLGAFRDSAVATALKLTAEQREKIRRIEADVFYSLGDRRSGGEPQKINFEEKQRDAMSQILAVLTDEQKQRWAEKTGDPFAGPIRRFPDGPTRPFGPPPPKP